MLYPRHLKSRMRQTLLDSPVVLLNGARQVGKSTVAERIYEPELNAQYINLDGVTALSAAQASPEGFIDSLRDRVIIDEVQRVPELFLAIKRAVDKKRIPGRFLLTGSTNVLMGPKLADPLVGRISIHTLWPLSQGEIRNVRETFVDFLLGEGTPPKLRGVSQNELVQSVVTGGYPEVLKRKSNGQRTDWFEGYITTILERDVRELSQIEGLTALPNLLQLLAARTGSLLNTSELTRTSRIANTTLKRYLALLQAVFLIHSVSAWSANISKRLVKSPKLYLADTGLAAYLQGVDHAAIEANRNLLGPLLENFVVMELIKQIAWSQSRPELFHFRTQTGQETDFVLRTRAGNVAAVEVKAASSVKANSFAGMKLLREELGGKFKRGVVLYTGTETVAFEPDLIAVPISALWEIGEFVTGFTVEHFTLSMTLEEFRSKVKEAQLEMPEEKNTNYPDLIRTFEFTKVLYQPLDAKWKPSFNFLNDNGTYRLYKIEGTFKMSPTDALPLLEREFGEPLQEGLGYKWFKDGTKLRMLPALSSGSLLSFTHDDLINESSRLMAEDLDSRSG